MSSRQKGSLAGVDLNLTKIEMKKRKREERMEELRKKSDADKMKTFEKDYNNETENKNGDNIEEEQLQDPDVNFNLPQKRKKVVLEIDPKKIVQQTAGTTDRLGMSSRQTAMMLSNVIQAGGGDLAQVPVSKSAVHRQRKIAR